MGRWAQLPSILLAHKAPREQLATQLIDVVAAVDSGDAELLQPPAPPPHAVFNRFCGDRLFMGPCTGCVLGGFPVADGVAGIGLRQKFGCEQ
jgi:hypothetical protein